MIYRSVIYVYISICMYVYIYIYIFVCTHMYLGFRDRYDIFESAFTKTKFQKMCMCISYRHAL